MFIYARGGESFAKGDPVWDQPYVWWSEHRPGTVIDRHDFEKWIEENRIEIVLFNEQSWMPPVLWAKENGCKTVAYVDYYTPELVPLFLAYDGVWCNTKRHFSVFKDHPGARYIPWGTDVQLFSPQQIHVSDDITFFHSAGMGGADPARGIKPRKGTDLAIKAFGMVDGPARLVVHSQLPIHAFGKETEETLKSDERISFIEQTVSAPGLYHLGDIYLYPTRLEGIGLSIMEALACGLPVLTTNVGPCNEFILDGDNGWLVDVESTHKRSDGYYWPLAECSLQHLAALIQNCIANRQDRRLLGENARKYAEQHLDWRNNRQLIQNCIEELARAKPCLLPASIVQGIKAQQNSPGLVAKVVRRVKREAIRFRHDLARHGHE